MSGLLTTVLTIGVAAAMLLLFKARVDAAWRQAAVELGLPLMGALFSAHRLSGTVKGWRVKIGPVQGGEMSGTTIRVWNECLLPSSLLLKGEGAGSRLVKSIHGREDLLTGDAHFDRDIYVDGFPADTLARLDSKARRQVRVTLAVRNTKIEGGQIVRPLAGVLTDAGYLVRQVEELVALAESLRLTRDVPDQLAHNVEHEPNAEVRLRNLRAAQGMPSLFAATGATRASRVACNDQDPRLRLEGAIHLDDDEGFPVLAELVDPADTSGAGPQSRVPMAIRVQALRHLVEYFDGERIVPILQRQFEIGTPRLVEAAIRGARQRQLIPLLPDLRKRIAGADEEVALAIATAVSDIGDRSAEADLLQLLEHDSARVQEQAARGLGEHGSVRAVPALRERLLRASAQRALRRSVERAIQRIQERLEGAEAGQLTLANAAQARIGALSLAGGQGGEVALVDLDLSRDSTRRPAAPDENTASPAGSYAVTECSEDP